jgi:fermentation-respiration switch protein FrsA (DUF1100 family)
LREDVEFLSGGARCAAWLYRPEGTDGDVPCVVMAHGFTGVREQRLDVYAERFAAAGLAVLLFDYRHFGASAGEPRQLVHIGRQLEDWRAAIAFARVRDGIDPKRIALWGSSFSGGHVVAIAAGDPEVAAVVSQAPFTTGLAAIGAGTPLGALRLTLAGIKDQVAAALGRSPAYIPAVGHPGTVAAMTREEAYPGFHGIDPPESTWRNEFTPRVMLRMGLYRPYAKLAKVRCPVLTCVCTQDQTTPPGPAARAAERSANTELRSYDQGHFEIYVGAPFERAVGDQTEFLLRNLVGSPVLTPAGDDLLEAADLEDEGEGGKADGEGEDADRDLLPDGVGRDDRA